MKKWTKWCKFFSKVGDCFKFSKSLNSSTGSLSGWYCLHLFSSLTFSSVRYKILILVFFDDLKGPKVKSNWSHAKIKGFQNYSLNQLSWWTQKILVSRCQTRPMSAWFNLRSHRAAHFDRSHNNKYRFWSVLPPIF